MTSRDEYLQKFKATLDDWNADIDKLEAKTHEAQGDAQSQYHKQLEALREMRDDAQKQYTELQNAAADAWDAMLLGTEKAWQAWVDAFDDARSKFKAKS
jgi:chromosome segregation ATPase